MIGLGLGLCSISNKIYGSFTPLSIPNLALWLDAADTATITHSGGNVSAWADKSGNGNNATQPTPANQPVTNSRTINGLNVLDFNVAEPRMNINPALTGDKNLTLFIVHSIDVGRAHRIMNGLSGGGTRFLIQQNLVQYSYLNRNDFAGAIVNASFDTNPHIGIARRDGVNHRAGRDGILGTVRADAQDFVLSPLNIGSAGAADPLDGTIAEILLFQRGLTNNEMNRVGNYLAQKWGIIWNTVSEAPNDVAGLQLWLDATVPSSISQAGNNVTEWRDISGNGRHFGQTTASVQPTTGTGNINGLNAINFDGADDLLTNGSNLGGILTGDNTFFLVSQADVNNEIGSLISANTADEFAVFYNNTQYRYHHRAASTPPFSGESVINSPQPDTNRHILVGRRNATTEYRLFLDGGLGTPQAGGVSNVTATSFNIGGQSISFRQFDGRIGEIAAYNRLLTNAEVNQIGNYLATKWGVTWTNI